jgi:isopentenyldiphosphate isomerase
LLGLIAAIQLGAADPRIGSWTVISAQSTLDPPNKLSITSLHDGVHVVMSGEMQLDFSAKKNGHETSVPGNPGFNQVELHRIDKKQAEVKEMKDGALVATVREKLSSDGNELTVTTSSNGRADQITVWTRTGGAKVASDPMAGEWTQDLSKTRLRQALPLKIETDGRDGVRFSGDFSYTARFDGKQYDLKNSRNDTVTLELVDPHTVDSIYRRDNQVAQKDRWVVSNDGQQMTLTTTGTFETGQRLTEKLVFKKQ